jgi:hypothetical protein
VPADPSSDQVRDHGGDPLAALLRTDEIERPRPGFRDELRAELMSRPPVLGTPPSGAASRPLLLAIAAVALIAAVGMLRLGPWTVGPFGSSAEVAPESGAGHVVQDGVAPAATKDSGGSMDSQDQPRPAVVPAGSSAPTDDEQRPSVGPSASESEAEPTSGTTDFTTTVPPLTPTAPIIVPARADTPVAGPTDGSSDRPPSGATATEDDVPDYTPGPRQPTDTPVPPTSTDSGYPALPSAPTAAPTNAGLPTAIAP